MRNDRPQCHAGKDGDCLWEKCPQLRDNEPRLSGRHCPLAQTWRKVYVPSLEKPVYFTEEAAAQAVLAQCTPQEEDTP
jgi:hypothetical protein